MGKKLAETKQYNHNLPIQLMDLFAEWCLPGKDYAIKVAGAILHYMTVPCAAREACEKAAYTDNIEAAIEQLVPTDAPLLTSQQIAEQLEALLVAVRADASMNTKLVKEKAPRTRKSGQRRRESG